MADAQKFVQAQTFFLSGSGSIVGATSLTLSSMYQIDGTTTLTMTNFGTKGFMVLEPNNLTQEEAITFTGITQNANLTATLTGVKTVLFIDPYTETAGTTKAHPGGSKAIVTNSAAFYAALSGKSNDESITGIWTFNSNAIPRISAASTYTAGGSELYLATKAYADSLTFSGAPNASTTQKGIVELPYQAEVDTRATTGATGALLSVTPDKLRTVLTTDYVVDTGTKAAYAIAPTPAVTVYTVGMTFLFKATNGNTAAPTLNVNSLGAKNLTRGKATLRAEDIRTNYIVGVVYTAGGEFEITSASAQVPISQDGQEIYGTSTTGTTAYIVGLVPAVSRYTAGMVVNFTPDTGGGHATINVNSLGVKNIYNYAAGTLGAVRTGDILANQIASIVYDGTQFQLQSPVSGASSFVGALTATGTISASTVIDTIFTTQFTPKIITIYYRMLGLDASVAKYSAGVRTYNGTTPVGGQDLYSGVSDATAIVAGATYPVMTAAAPTVGSGASNGMQCDLSIVNIKIDSFTVRLTFTEVGTATGNCTFYPVAMK